MELNDITGVSGAPPSEAARSATLGRDDFLRMLVAQLENQDPLNPQDATEFSAQLAQFSSLEQLLQMGEAMTEVAESQRALAGVVQGLASTSLIGHEALAQADQFEVGTSGELVSRPGFELEAAASQISLRIRNSSGALVRSSELGGRGQGFHQIEAEVFGGLSPGIYEFELAARSSESSVAVTSFVEGRVTGAIPSASAPLLQIGGVLVPYLDISEIRKADSGT